MSGGNTEGFVIPSAGRAVVLRRDISWGNVMLRFPPCANGEGAGAGAAGGDPFFEDVEAKLVDLGLSRDLMRYDSFLTRMANTPGFSSPCVEP
jgi:hypothetical protein